MIEDPKAPLPPRPARQRGPGRPREFVDPSEMSLKLEASLHDALIIEANRRGITPSKLARQLLDEALNRRTQ